MRVVQLLSKRELEQTPERPGVVYWVMRALLEIAFRARKLKVRPVVSPAQLERIDVIDMSLLVP